MRPFLGQREHQGAQKRLTDAGHQARQDLSRSHIAPAHNTLQKRAPSSQACFFEIGDSHLKEGIDAAEVVHFGHVLDGDVLRERLFYKMTEATLLYLKGKYIKMIKDE